MSSLAAAKADNFYFPEDFDPKSHRTLNRYHGQHALRDRALADGGLIVRFEVPFNLACARCGDSIAKGVRFNAAKRQAGSYHSTKVWRFEMTHHCGSVIVIETDPQKADYTVVSGARRRAAPGRAELGAEDEEEDAAAARLLASDEALLGPVDAVPRDHAVGREKGPTSGAGSAATLTDPMAALERSTAAARRASERASRLEALEQRSDARHASGNGLVLNRALRDRMRAAREEEKGLEAQRWHLGVSEAVRLLPQSREDADGARRAMAAAAARGSSEDPERRRQRILSEPIFGGAGGAGGSGGVAAALAAEREKKKKNKRPREPAAAAAAPALPPAQKPKGPSVASWAPPLARAPKRR
jgi:coiled-coil domain-containing protein 130